MKAIRSARLDDATAIADVLTAAFLDDPPPRYLETFTERQRRVLRASRVGRHRDLRPSATTSPCMPWSASPSG